jgi:UDP-glucose 4-epimerase
VIDSLWEHGGGRRANVPNGVSLVHMDIRDEAIGRVFADFKPEIINHHAAQHSVAISSRDPIYDAQINVIGLLNVLEHARRSGARKVIFAAADYRRHAAASQFTLRDNQDGGRALPALLPRFQRA